MATMAESRSSGRFAAVAVDLRTQIVVELRRSLPQSRPHRGILMAPGQVADDGVGPMAEVGVPVLGHTEHLRHDDRRDHREVGDQVEAVIPRNEWRQQLVHDDANALLQVRHGPSSEQRRQAVAEPTVHLAVHRDHGRGFEPGEYLRSAGHRREVLAVVREHGGAVVEPGDHPPVNDVVPHDPAGRPNLLIVGIGILDDRRVEEVDVTLCARHQLPPSRVLQGRRYHPEAAGVVGRGTGGR